MARARYTESMMRLITRSCGPSTSPSPRGLGGVHPPVVGDGLGHRRKRGSVDASVPSKSCWCSQVRSLRSSPRPTRVRRVRAQVALVGADEHPVGHRKVQGHVDRRGRHADRQVVGEVEVRCHRRGCRARRWPEPRVLHRHPGTRTRARPSPAHRVRRCRSRSPRARRRHGRTHPRWRWRGLRLRWCSAPPAAWTRRCWPARCTARWWWGRRHR